MNIKDLLLLILPFISGVVSAWITYFFTIRVKKSEFIHKYKEEKYSNLIVLLKAFLGDTATGELKRKFFDEEYRSWLYSSDDVVKHINILVSHLSINGSKESKKANGGKMLGNIVLSMRKDLLGKTKLTYKDFHFTNVIDK